MDVLPAHLSGPWVRRPPSTDAVDAERGVRGFELSTLVPLSALRPVGRRPPQEV